MTDINERRAVFQAADAELRILTALERIERAQTELYAAYADLSPVLGMVRNWERAGKIADQVKAFWHRLDRDFQAKRGQWRLDK